MSEINEYLIVDKQGTITGTTHMLWVLWSQQKQMGIEVIGQIPLCG